MPTRRKILFAIAGAAFASAVHAEPAPTANDAAALAFVKSIYEPYTKAGTDGTLIDSGKKLRRYFEPQLAAAMDKDQKAAHGEVGSLDFDPFIDAQDWEFKAFDVALKDTAPGKITATVTFTSLKELTTIVLDLVKIKNDWRIYDITWQRDKNPDSPKTLRELFKMKRST
jgi:uncharacterized protein DUF3828